MLHFLTLMLRGESSRTLKNHFFQSSLRKRESLLIKLNYKVITRKNTEVIQFEYFHSLFLK